MCSASRILVRSGSLREGTGRRARVCGPPRSVRILRQHACPHVQLSARAIQSTLAPMNWRRGLLLAGINLEIAMPMWSESQCSLEDSHLFSQTAGGLNRGHASRQSLDFLRSFRSRSRWQESGHCPLVWHGSGTSPFSSGNPSISPGNQPSPVCGV